MDELTVRRIMLMVLLTFCTCALFLISRGLVDRSRPVYAAPTLLRKGTVSFDVSRIKDATLLAIAVSPQGSIGMLDATSGAVQVFSATGAFLYQTPTELPGIGKLQHPLGIAFGDREELFVVDTGNQRIVQFVPDGTVRILGRPGIFNGQFVLPTALTAFEGSVFVLDSALCRISQFGADGMFLNKAGRKGDGPAAFHVPTALANDGGSGLIVLDSRQSMVSQFDGQLGFQQQRRIAGSDAGFVITKAAFAGDGLSFFLAKGRQEIAVFYQQIAVDLLTPQKMGLESPFWTDLTGHQNTLYLLDGKNRKVDLFEIQ